MEALVITQWEVLRYLLASTLPVHTVTTPPQLDQCTSSVP